MGREREERGETAVDSLRDRVSEMGWVTEGSELVGRKGLAPLCGHWMLGDGLPASRR